MNKMLTASIMAIVTFMVFAANAFAAAPCIGALCEPEMPEALKK